MIWRRLVPLALAVTGLVAIVAIAAHGRPLGSGGGTGSGLPPAFWDFLFTTFVILVVLLMIGGIAAIRLLARERVEIASFNQRTARALAVLFGVVILVVFVARHINLQHLFHRNGTPPTTPTTPNAAGNPNHHPAARHVQFRWEELAVVLGALGVLAVATRKRLTPRTQRIAPDVLAAALDESLDDLRADPDLRRAIIAAYARMETSLAAAGVPRHHAETPLEYVERALLTLDTSASAVRRLTDLFEWARFSHHEPEPSMRDEAIDALIAVRDELRASEPAAT